jgi:hypothetical protein
MKWRIFFGICGTKSWAEASLCARATRALGTRPGVNLLGRAVIHSVALPAARVRP